MGLCDFLNVKKSESEEPKRYTGKELLCFPNTYTLIGLVTSGDDPKKDVIKEIYSTEYENGYGSFNWRVTFEENDYENLEQILTKVFYYTDDKILIGPNIKRDIQFISYVWYQAFNKPFTNDFVDISRLAQRVLPRLKKYALYDIAAYYKVKLRNVEGLKKDCQTSWYTYQELTRSAKETGDFNRLNKLAGIK